MPVLQPRHHVRRRVLKSCLIAGSLLMAVACGTTARSPGPSPVTSTYEHATGDGIRRDCGYSSPLPGKPGWSIWLFCDTEVTGAHGRKVERLILGEGSAAYGPYQAGQAPSSLTELPSPPARPVFPSAAAPQPFLPAPQGLQLPGSMLPCSGPGAYPAAWISGVTTVPAATARAATTPGTLLITYDDYCVNATWDTVTAEGFGLAEYDPARNLMQADALVFRSGLGLALPAQQVLGSPLVAADGYLYLFGFCHAGPAQPGCGASGVFLARTVAAPAYWGNPFSYQYWAGDGWSSSLAAARSLLPGGQPLGISVGDYSADGEGLVMIEQTSLGGSFRVWRAGSPTSQWRQILAGHVPCAKGAETGTQGLCRALIGHPELSTRDSLLISYYDPASYHVDVLAYPW
jgi:hypothetical protein